MGGENHHPGGRQAHLSINIQVVFHESDGLGQEFFKRDVAGSPILRHNATVISRVGDVGNIPLSRFQADEVGKVFSREVIGPGRV